MQQPIEIETPSEGFGGINTAQEPTSLGIGQSRYLLNAYQGKLGALTQRPGSVPVTTTALGATIPYLTLYKASATSVDPDIIAASGTTLYKFNGTNALTAQTMTNPLNTADIYTTAFTNATLVSVLFITDQSNMKQYNGTEVKNIPPAPDDASPAPANSLNSINAKKPKYCWVHSGHVFVSPGNNEVFYSKRYQFDYFPSTQWFILVRENDYVNGPGIAFNNVCLIPMRRGWAILTGVNFDSFDASTFLNTVHGVVAPRSIARITYPDGQQTIAYLSDDGVHEIYDTGILDTGTRQYATRALMKERVDFDALGLTESEKKAAVAFYDEVSNLYMLRFNKGATKYIYCYDTRNGEWYPWSGIDANGFVKIGGVVYFAGTMGHLHKLDPTLYDDWNNAAKTSGTPIDFDRISGMMAFQSDGYMSYLDYYMVSAKQFDVPASLDISIVFVSTLDEREKVIQNQYLTWDVTAWDEAVWANINYTDLVGNPKRQIYKKKSFYFQIRWRNNRSEPVEIYKEKIIGRVT